MGHAASRQPTTTPGRHRLEDGDPAWCCRLCCTEDLTNTEIVARQAGARLRMSLL